MLVFSLQPSVLRHSALSIANDPEELGPSENTERKTLLLIISLDDSSG